MDDGKETKINEKVSTTFLSLKQENNSYELKKIGSGYYVYISSGRRDKDTGKVRKISIYKGKITPDGKFVPVRHKKNYVLRELAARISQEQSLAGSGTGTIQNHGVNVRLDSLKHEKTILTALSMNGRISTSVLSKMLGMSINATAWQVKNLERKYGIRYLPEIDVTKFGYMQFMVTVKFLEETPPAEKLKAAIHNEPRAQLAMLTKGDFDLLIYVLAKTVEEASALLIDIRDRLSNYGSIWSMIPVYETYGFVALRDSFIDELKKSGALLEREYAVLKELNIDASVEFSKIDEKYGFDSGRASYSYYKLKKEGKIRRATITMQKAPVRYIGVMLETIIYKSKFLEHRQSSLSNIIEESKMPTNKYLAAYDTTTPDGTIFFIPIYEYNELDKAADEIRHLDLGVKLTTQAISNILVGNCICRHFDNAHSIQQEILEKKYKIPKAERKNYEETGRKKAEKIRFDIRGARITKEDADLSQILP